MEIARMACALGADVYIVRISFSLTSLYVAKLICDGRKPSFWALLYCQSAKSLKSFNICSTDAWPAMGYRRRPSLSRIWTVAPERAVG